MLFGNCPEMEDNMSVGESSHHARVTNANQYKSKHFNLYTNISSADKLKLTAEQEFTINTTIL